MTTKQELLDKIAELQAKVDAMPDDKPKGVPRDDERYWLLTWSGCAPSVWTNDPVDFARLKRGDVYLTEEAAKRADDKRILLKELRDFADFEPDWSDEWQVKYYLVYDHMGEEWAASQDCTIALPCVQYFGTDARIQEAIEHFGDRLDLLL